MKAVGGECEVFLNRVRRLHLGFYRLVKSTYYEEVNPPNFVTQEILFTGNGITYMKAIILSAGQGTRLLPMTATKPNER